MKIANRLGLALVLCVVMVAHGDGDRIILGPDQIFTGIYDPPGTQLGMAAVAVSDAIAVASWREGFRVYRRDASEAATWVEDGDFPTEFGIATVAVSGETIVVSDGVGRVDVYVQDGGSWELQDTLSERNGFPEHRFGATLAVAEETIVVGAPGCGDAFAPKAGCAYVFDRVGSGWAERDRLEPGDLEEGDRFGTALAMAGDLVAIGAPGGNAAYVFERRGDDWTESARLLPEDLDRARWFGGAIDLAGSSVFVGDRSAMNDPGEPRGSAHVFDVSAGDWSETARLTPQNLSRPDGEGCVDYWYVIGFGGSLAALSENHLVVGAPGTNSGWVCGGGSSSGSGSSSSSSFSSSSAGTAHVFVRGDGWRETTLLPSLGESSGFPSNPPGGGFSSALSGFGGTALANAFIWRCFETRLVCGEGVCHRVCAGLSNAGVIGFYALNAKPVARCTDVTVAAGPECSAEALVDDGSGDPDDDPIEMAQDPSGPFLLGETPVTLTVTDDKGLSDSCNATVSVVDETPPDMSVKVHPSVLWPPNHKLIDVEAAVTAEDNCGSPRMWLESVASSQPEGRAHAPDVAGATLGSADVDFQLRAERDARAGSRTYTVTYAATDSAGNESTVSAEVEVPISRGKDKR